MPVRQSTRAQSALLALVVALLAALPLVGERVTPWESFATQATRHEVTQVSVADALPPDAKGYTTATLHWRHGLLRRVTEVRQVVPSPDEQGDAGSPTPQGHHVITGDMTAALHQLDPTLRVLTAPESRGHAEVAGWWAPAWMMLPTLLWWLAAVGLCLAGRDEPPLATRWGWLWWFLSPASIPALVLYLVLAIRARATGVDPRRRGRLTGGWSLLLAVLLSGAVAGLLRMG